MLLTGQRLLITGGRGFIGNNLIRRIQERTGESTRLTVLDNAVDVRDGGEIEAVEYVKGDVRDLATMVDLARRSDVIIHLAAHTGVIESVREPDVDFDVNVRGTLNVLLAAREAKGTSVVLASTGGALMGDAPLPIREETVPRPLSPYGASKVAAEGYGHAFAASYGVRVLTLRFSNVYGPHSWKKGSVIPHFLREILAGRVITVYGDGSQIRDFVFVEDVCDGILQAIESDAAGVFQLGSGKPTSIKELVAAMRGVVGADQMVHVQYAPARPGEVSKTYCDVSKARQAFAFKAGVSLEHGLSKTWKWFLDHKH